MQKRTLKVALLAVLATVIVFGISGVALADQTWRDLPDTVTAKYGITDNQIAAISEGYSTGVWKPFQSVTRAQFTKMAVKAFGIPIVQSAIASYTDVPKSNPYYAYIEGAKAAGVVQGTTPTTFNPNANITRQQALAIVSRYIAKVQGYDLATMYTAAEITQLLSHFGDAASVSADLRDEVAFAFDMGITNGDDYGNVKPLANLMRIQGAALLIRAKDMVPPKLWTAANLRLVSSDKTEGLIGQTFSATFEVTTADGHPARGILVDFDSLAGPEFYVGSITPQAAVTDGNGRATVKLVSTEPGTQRMTARVAGLDTVYTTRYWLVLDEVYTTSTSRWAQNNAGVEHAWGVRVVVFGPGPRSTSQNDWYNAIDADFDPANLHVDDGVDVNCAPASVVGADYEDGWDYEVEKGLSLLGFAPRTMAGIDVQWAIYNKVDDPTTLPDETEVSVGNIVAVDGVSITPARTAVGTTDASGYSWIKVNSEAIGVTHTEAVADYSGNPYPRQLFAHGTFHDTQQHYTDWTDQSAVNARQTKNWIAHIIGGDPSGPVTPGYSTANIGEELTLTITLIDSFGNALPGKAVEWTMQGVGFFQTDDAGDTSSPETASKNKDFDVTDAFGRATLFVKSYKVGEQIIHAKVRDKGTGGSEGSYATHTAEVQWFDADVVTFDDITTQDLWVDKYTDVSDGVIDNYWDPQNEALAGNPVDTTHTFVLHVYGLKLEYDPVQDYPNRQTPYFDSDAGGLSYDRVLDARDAAYFGGILLCPVNETSRALWYQERFLAPWGYGTGQARVPTLTGYNYTFDAGWVDAFPRDLNGNGVIEAKAEIWNDVNANRIKDPGEVTYADERGTVQVEVGGVWITLSFEGAYTKYDHNDDGHKELFTGVPGIYLPLEGKSVRFLAANRDGRGLTNTGIHFDGVTIDAVAATIDPLAPNEVLTDANGKASVDVTTTKKGPVTIKAVVDWEGNPHNGVALATAYAKKTWMAGSVSGDVTIQIYIDGVKVATNKEGSLRDAIGNPLSGRSLAYEFDEAGNKVLNSAHVHVRVLDAYGNDLPDYEVVYLLEDINSWVGGSQDAASTFMPWAFLVDLTDDTDEEGLITYDKNGHAPDSDEPRPSDDPYGLIVGPGGTKAFFFNQWLGSEKPVYRGHAGVDFWHARTPYMGFLGYHGHYVEVADYYLWPTTYPGADWLFDGFDGVLDGSYVGTEFWSIDPTWPQSHVGLATDGAKAWTLNGFYDADDGPGVDIQPSLLVGSGVDIQLADALVEEYAFAGAHLKSILRVQVYSPADGLVIEGQPLWSHQVHQVWEIPVPTTIELEPIIDYVIAGNGANHQTTTLTATVLDQFGEPIRDVEVYFNSKNLEGRLGAPLVDFLVGLTDENGNVAITRSQLLAGAWGVEEIIATFDRDGDSVIEPSDLNSNKAIIQWVFDDSSGAALRNADGTISYGSNLVTVAAGQQRVLVAAGVTPWSGRNIWIHRSPTDAQVGAGIYSSVGLNTNTSVTWVSGNGVWLKAHSTDTDQAPNWMYYRVP